MVKQFSKTPRSCARCSGPFVGKSPSTLYCSVDCLFDDKLTKRSDDECWPWSGTISTAGYGVVGHRGTTIGAHRFSYERTNGPIPQGMVIRHTCHNPPCCNPAHLLVGTQRDNMLDKVAAGRHLHGEAHNKAKLTDETALQAFNEAGSHEEIGKKYGVSRHTIRDLKQGKSWRHVTHPTIH